jgi:hypothetical protein
MTKHSTESGTAPKLDGSDGFSSLLSRLVRVPKAELLAEERKYEAAKKRRPQKAKKKP